MTVSLKALLEKREQLKARLTQINSSVPTITALPVVTASVLAMSTWV